MENTSSPGVCPSCGHPESSFQRTMAGTEIRMCAECGSAFSALLPKTGELEAIYNELYEEDGMYRHHRTEVSVIRAAMKKGKAPKVGWEQKLFFRHCRPSPTGNRLLDVGCGTGLFITAAVKSGWQVRGIDVSEQAIELGRVAHGLDVQAQRIEQLCEEEASFSAITAWEVVEHLAEPRKFFKTVLSLLRPDGLFAGSLPNYARLRYRYGDDLGWLSVPPVHLNYWDPPSFRYVLSKAGFKDVLIRVPRICVDTLRPLGSPDFKRLTRFLKIAFGTDLPTTMSFLARPAR